ncbi:DUF6600 domain-containing protein [Pedobacter metabolipauper]|uniref:YXWGXW repeat-containing protein n=1 Tax=Pedobacter metabolipauper TaxID=425513 RepID=A0A4R6SV76_9SPHI|nr:DUF6600 domain-containing protein [Pedobacter metabolipauper]TDQ09680.1 hypothetical protein ATK78_1836 [Pedobacter metabolipauper]
MKNMIKLPAIVLGLMLLLTGTTQRVMAQDEDISLQSFYDELSPYGTWIQDPQYGYVWRPDVEQSDFRPYYSNGRWAMTEYGNTWVSNYDWGWAPFHYGRWVYNRYNQWVWIPDTVWGPAWVSWRSGGGYYGWAPMGPGMNINVNINIPNLWWVFVPHRNIYYNNFPRYYSRRNVVYINNTTIINNTYVRNSRSYYTGPRIDDIRRDTRQNVPVYSVNRTGRPGRTSVNGNRLDIYTPPRSTRSNSNVAAAPRTVVRGEGYASARPERAGTDSRNPNGTASREGVRGSSDAVRSGERIERMDRGTVGGRNENGTRPERTGDMQQGQPQRGTQSRSDVQRSETMQRPEGQQRQEQSRPDQGRSQQQAQPRQEQPQRMERRPEPQQQAEQPQRQQAQPQRQEQPQPQRQQQAQPQRQEQPQRQQQAQPQRQERSSEGRSSQGSSSSRPARGRG